MTFVIEEDVKWRDDHARFAIQPYLLLTLQELALLERAVADNDPHNWIQNAVLDTAREADEIQREEV